MKLVFSMTLALALLTSAPALAGGGGDKIDVMTQNQYLGADLDPIVIPPEGGFPPGGFNDAVVAALEQVADNDFETRAGLLATLIANRLPELVGLQEVFIFACTDIIPPMPNQGCDHPDVRDAFNDHLELTLGALEDLDENYEAVATVVNLDTTALGIPGIPFVIDGVPALVNIIDRDVILVRGDIFANEDSDIEPVDFNCTKPSADGCNYQLVAEAVVEIPNPVGGDPISVTIPIERGWVGVDLTIDGKDYRFIDTHLEVQEPDGTQLSSIVQAVQAQELIATLANTTPAGRSLIVVGDINSSSEDGLINVPPEFTPPLPPVIVPPYTQFVSVGGLPDGYIPGGYTDAWTVTGKIPGFSCCQEPDLSNISSVHDERIDVIFSLDPEAWLNKAKKKRVLGSKVPDKSAPDGLWPSDHGSVAAQLEFE